MQKQISIYKMFKHDIFFLRIDYIYIHTHTIEKIFILLKSIRRRVIALLGF